VRAVNKQVVRRQEKYPTSMLFHVSDKHMIYGILPDFAAGETWETLHAGLHAKGDANHEHEGTSDE
jgi:hypothetical protein